MQAKDALERAVSGAGDALIRLSHVIHERPDTALEEHYAAGRVAEELARHVLEIEGAMHRDAIQRGRDTRQDVPRVRRSS